MRRLAIGLLAAAACWSLIPAPAHAQEEDELGRVDVLLVSGLFDRVVVDAIDDAIDEAASAGAQALILQVNSRGAVVGDERWEALPERAKAERLSEGVAFVDEVADLTAGEPWRADRINVPVVAMYGEFGREHHRDGSHYLAELLSDREAIEIAGARHNAPFTHPEAVAAALRELESRAPA